MNCSCSLFLSLGSAEQQEGHNTNFPSSRSQSLFTGLPSDCRAPPGLALWFAVLCFNCKLRLGAIRLPT